MTGAIEFALADQQRRGTLLSVEFLNWASNNAAGDSEDGGYFSDLWKGFETHGLCTEADMPYQPKFDPSKGPGPDALKHAMELRGAGLRMHWIKPWDVQTGLTDKEFSEIKETLRRQWPVCGGLRWPKQEHWKDGVLEMAPPEGVRDGHSVLLVGSRDDPAQPGGGVFLIRNSGKGLRDSAMTYEYARAYMNNAVWIDHGPAASPPPGASRGDAAAASIDLRPVFTQWDSHRGERASRHLLRIHADRGHRVCPGRQAAPRHPAEPRVSGLDLPRSDRRSGDGPRGGRRQVLRSVEGLRSRTWICDEAQMPYREEIDPALRPSDEAVSPPCTLRSLGLRLHWIKPWDPTTGLTEAEFAEIKQTLQRQWPVCGGFRWPTHAQWKDRVLAAPAEGVYDGHSVLLVGYRDDPAQPGGGVFLIRNSSKGPGDAAMTYEYARTYMNDAVWIDHCAADVGTDRAPRPPARCLPGREAPR